jgi:hypothetical protein
MVTDPACLGCGWPVDLPRAPLSQVRARTISHHVSGAPGGPMPTEVSRDTSATPRTFRSFFTAASSAVPMMEPISSRTSLTLSPALARSLSEPGLHPVGFLLSQVVVRLTPIGGRTYAFDCTAAVGTSRQPPGKNKQPAGVIELRSPWARNPAYPSSGRVMVKKRKVCAASPGRNGGRCGDARHGEDRAGPASPASADPRSR